MAKPKQYPVKRWILETLRGYMEAAKCRTLDTFTAEQDRCPKCGKYVPYAATTSACCGQIPIRIMENREVI